MKNTTYLDLKKRKEKRILIHSNCLIDGEFRSKYCHKLNLKRWVKWKSKSKSNNKLKEENKEQKEIKTAVAEGGEGESSNEEYDNLSPEQSGFANEEDKKEEDTIKPAEVPTEKDKLKNTKEEDEEDEIEYVDIFEGLTEE